MTDEKKIWFPAKTHGWAGAENSFPNIGSRMIWRAFYFPMIGTFFQELKPSITAE